MYVIIWNYNLHYVLLSLQLVWFLKILTFEAHSCFHNLLPVYHHLLVTSHHRKCTKLAPLSQHILAFKLYQFNPLWNYLNFHTNESFKFNKRFGENGSEIETCFSSKPVDVNCCIEFKNANHWLHQHKWFNKHIMENLDN